MDNPLELAKALPVGEPQVDASNPLELAKRLPIGDIVPSDEKDVSPESVTSFLTRSLKNETTWAEVEPKLKKAGLDPEQYRQGYQLGEVKAVQKGEGIGTMERFLGSSIPFGSAIRNWREEREYGAAVKRFQENKATPQDIFIIGRYERKQEVEHKLGTGAAIAAEVARIPALLGEFGAGGKVVRGAGSLLPGATGRALTAGGILPRAAQGAAATPFIPSTYLQRGAQNQNANPEESTFQSYAPAIALAASQNAVLGQMQGILSGAPITRAGRIIGKTAVGMGESAAADVGATALDRAAKSITGSTLGLDTQWGPLAQWVKAESSGDRVAEARKAAIVQFATFSLFSAMHSGKEIPAKTFKDAIDSGATPEQLAKLGAEFLDTIRRAEEEAVQQSRGALEGDMKAAQDLIDKAKAKAGEQFKEAHKDDETPLGDLARAYGDALIRDPEAVHGDEGPIPQPQEARSGAISPPAEAPAGKPEAAPEGPTEPQSDAPSPPPKVDLSRFQRPEPAQELIDRLGLGEKATVEDGLAMVEIGDKRVTLNYDPTANKVAVGFFDKQGTDQLASVPPAMRGSSASLFRAFKQVAEKLRDNGLGVEYSAHAETEAEQRADHARREAAAKKNGNTIEPFKYREGKSARDEAYSSVLLDLGYKVESRSIEPGTDGGKLVRTSWRAPVAGEGRVGSSDWSGGRGIKFGELSAMLLKKPGEESVKEATAIERARTFAEKLEAEAREAFKLKGGESLYSGFDPTMIVPLAKYTAAKLIKGSLTFAEFSASVVKRFGEAVRPHLPEIWKQAGEIARPHGNLGKMNLLERMRKRQATHDFLAGLPQSPKAEPGFVSPGERPIVPPAKPRPTRYETVEGEHTSFGLEPDKPLLERVDSILRSQEVHEALGSSAVPSRASGGGRPISELPDNAQGRKEAKRRAKRAARSRKVDQQKGELMAMVMMERLKGATIGQVDKRGAKQFDDSLRAVSHALKVKGYTVSHTSVDTYSEKVFELLRAKMPWTLGQFPTAKAWIADIVASNRAAAVADGSISAEDVKGFDGNAEDVAAFSAHNRKLMKEEALKIQAELLETKRHLLNALKTEAIDEEKYQKLAALLLPKRLRGIEAEGEDVQGQPEEVQAENRPAQSRRTNPQSKAAGNATVPIVMEGDAPSPPEGAILQFMKGESGHYFFPTAQVFKGMRDWLVRTAMKGKQALFGAGRVNDPHVVLDTDPRNTPRAMLSHKTYTKAAYNQTGARNTSLPEIATTAWAFARDVARNLANSFKNTFAGRPDPFAGLPYADIIEAEIRNPGSQKLTPEQKDFIENWWKPTWEKLLRAMDAEGITFYDENGEKLSVEQMLKDGYFHRAAVKPTPEGEAAEARRFEVTGAKPGIKPGIMIERTHATQADAMAKGIKYKSAWEAMADFVELAYRKIADQRLANDPKLKGVDLVKKVRGRLFAENRDTIEAVRIIDPVEAGRLERRISAIAGQMATGNVRVAPTFRGKLYPQEVKEWLEAVYGERAGGIVKTIAAYNQEVRNVALGADASYLMLQMLPMLWPNPIRFARTAWSALKALADPNRMAKLAAERPELQDAMNVIAQTGGTIAQPPDQIIARGQTMLGKLPLVGKLFDQTYGRASQAMTNALDLAKLELFIANRPKDPKQLPRFVEALENSLGQGRMEKLGMTPERGLLERLAFLAPSFYRAHLKLAQQAFQGGAAGKLARKQIGSLMGGVFFTSLAALYALKATGQISDEEFEERLNPQRGKFLMVPVPLGDSSLEVGFGGLWVSLARTLGNAERYAEGQQTDNPAVRWYRGHAGTFIRMGWDIGEGKDYLGQPTGTIDTVKKSVMPLTVSQGIFGEGNLKQSIGNAAAGIVGLRSHSTSPSGEYLDKLRRVAPIQFGKRYEDLSFEQQAQLVQQFPETKPPSTEGARQRAMEQDELRSKRLTGMMPRDVRNRLKDVGKLNLPSYDPVQSIGGIPVPLTRAKQEKYEKILAEEYERTVRSWPMEQIMGLPPAMREKYVSSSFIKAKQVARARLFTEK